MQTTTLTGVQAISGVPTTLTSLYSYSGSGGATVSHLMLANKTGTACLVYVTLYNGTTDYYLAYQYQVSPQDTLNVLGESGSRIVLQNGWSIRVQAQLAATIDATCSVTTYT
jgi:hypothetical protein